MIASIAADGPIGESEANTRRWAMPEPKPRSIAEHFAKLPDPRIDRTKRHELVDILTIGVCAVISGADSFEGMESYGQAKQAWLQTFLALPNGIPSHDTFNRVFAHLHAKKFQECFLAWIASIAEATAGEVVAFDGKTLRHSFDRASSKAAIHMVSAWASTNRLVLGQVKVEDKSNEITAIPELLSMLALSGCIVSIDAMGCQTKIAAQIIEHEADYVLGLKGNQESLHEVVQEVFDEADQRDYEGILHDYYETQERGHGRAERRRYWTLDAQEWLEDIAMWAGLRTIVQVESQRTVKGETSVEWRYYISSLGLAAKPIAEAIRSHWGIENSVHWVLDIAFREDESRIRVDAAAENMAVLRHLALNLLKRETSLRAGIQAKRNRAGWDNAYLTKVLFG
jgi:predicted transposase YbfD/YdcC